MGLLIFIGLVLAVPGWFVYIRTPNWLLTGPPGYLDPVIKLLQVHNDFVGILTLQRLRDFSLILAIIGTALLLLPILMRRRR
jgi:hypothetical protein